MLMLITIFLGLMYPYIAPSPCPVAISHGTYNCGTCTINGPPNERVTGPCDCTFTCDSGYTLSSPNNPDRRCRASGTWNHALPSCSPSCQVTLGNGLTGTCSGCTIASQGQNKEVVGPCTCNFACQAGYTISTPGDADRDCSASGSWDVPVPTCNAIGNFNLNSRYSQVFMFPYKSSIELNA